MEAGQILGVPRPDEPVSAVAEGGQILKARRLLAPIYGWFSEGFDTADLQEAKLLLEELS